MIKNFIVTIIVVCSFIGCTTIRYVPVKGEDIIRTEYKEIIKDSLIYVPIEKETSTNNVSIQKDTTSVLSNTYSISTAEVKSGNLKHTLKTKSNDSIPTKIIYKDIIKTDSIYVNKVVIEEVEKPIRDKWFWYSIIGNIIFISLLGFALLTKIKKSISL